MLGQSVSSNTSNKRKEVNKVVVDSKSLAVQSSNKRFKTTPQVDTKKELADKTQQVYPFVVANLKFFSRLASPAHIAYCKKNIGDSLFVNLYAEINLNFYNKLHMSPITADAPFQRLQQFRAGITSMQQKPVDDKSLREFFADEKNSDAINYLHKEMGELKLFVFLSDLSKEKINKIIAIQDCLKVNAVFFQALVFATSAEEKGNTTPYLKCLNVLRGQIDRLPILKEILDQSVGGNVMQGIKKLTLPIHESFFIYLYQQLPNIEVLAWLPNVVPERQQMVLDAFIFIIDHQEFIAESFKSSFKLWADAKLTAEERQALQSFSAGFREVVNMAVDTRKSNPYEFPCATACFMDAVSGVPAELRARKLAKFLTHPENQAIVDYLLANAGILETVEKKWQASRSQSNPQPQQMTASAVGASLANVLNKTASNSDDKENIPPVVIVNNGAQALKKC